MLPDKSPVREASEGFRDEFEEDISAKHRRAEFEEEETGSSPSHLPFAPSSEFADTTTVDPSYIISLIRKLLPNNISTQKQAQNGTCSLYPLETTKASPLEDNMERESNNFKKLVDTETNDISVLPSILNDSCDPSIIDHIVNETYFSTSKNNWMGPDSRKVETSFVDHETELVDKENDWEDSGCILWDLSANRTHAEFMVNNLILEVLLEILRTSKSPRVKEICLGILGNLACHEIPSNAMTSSDGLIETAVYQLYLDDSVCLAETFRLLTVALQGSGSTLWAKALLSEQTCLRINWIVGNTLNAMLLEKSVDFLLAVINNKEVTNILLEPWMKLGLPNLVVNLLSCELSNLNENKLERTSFLDLILYLVETLSAVECGLEMKFPVEELCYLACRVIKLPDKYEYTSSCVSATVIIANLMVDGQHIALQLSQDHEFLQGLLETIPYVSDEPQARGALWCILERLLAQIVERDISILSLHHLVSSFLEKSSLIIDDLEGHSAEDSGSIPRTLLRIAGLLDEWIAQKDEEAEETVNIVDFEARAERLLQCCRKYGSLPAQGQKSSFGGSLSFAGLECLLPQWLHGHHP